MKKNKWYAKLFTYVLTIIFSPLILLCLFIWGLCVLFTFPADKKTFNESAYHRDLQLPFKLGILSDDIYRFYNAAVERNLNIHFCKQQNDVPGYFTYQGTQYIFPWFSQMSFSKEKDKWEIYYDGYWFDLYDEYAKHIDALKQVHPDTNIHILIERVCILNESLKELIIPDYLHIVDIYETAFENDETAVNIEHPENMCDLFRMMCEAPEIGGTFQLSGDSIVWNLNSDYRLELSQTQDNGLIELYRRKRYITHWHPDQNEMFNDVCSIGTKGNVLIVRDAFINNPVLYMGKLSKCPYPEKLKWKWGRIHHIIPD